MDDFMKGIVPLSLLCGLVYFACASVRPLFKDNFAQYVAQEVDEPYERGFCVVHNIGCERYSRWYGREDKKDFVKHEYYVYCMECVDSIDAGQMNRISRERWERFDDWEADADMYETAERMTSGKCADNIYELIYVRDKDFGVLWANADDKIFYRKFLRGQ